MNKRAAQIISWIMACCVLQGLGTGGRGSTYYKTVFRYTCTQYSGSGWPASTKQGSMHCDAIWKHCCEHSERNKGGELGGGGRGQINRHHQYIRAMLFGISLSRNCYQWDGWWVDFFFIQYPSLWATIIWDRQGDIKCIFWFILKRFSSAYSKTKCNGYLISPYGWFLGWHIF